MLRDLKYAAQEEVSVIACRHLIERRQEPLARHRWPHEAWRNNDDEIRLLLLVGSAAKQGTKHRYIADPRQLIVRLRVFGLQQSSNGEALAISQLHGSACAAHD